MNFMHNILRFFLNARFKCSDVLYKFKKIIFIPQFIKSTILIKRKLKEQGGNYHLTVTSANVH